MVDIKTISKCFKEVKRLTGDLLPDEQINQILDEAKIKIEENKFQDLESKTDKVLAQEIIDKHSYDIEQLHCCESICMSLLLSVASATAE